MIEKYPPPPSTYDPLRTNLGPVGFVKGAPQIDPLPMEIPPNMNPNMEIRNNEGPFFSSSNRRGGQSWANRNIDDYLQKMMPPSTSSVGSPWRTIDMNDWAQAAEHMPSQRLPNDRMMDSYYKPAPPMGKDLGANDLDVYNRTYRMQDFPRDARLAKENDIVDDAVTLRGLPDYMQKNAAEQLAKDAMDSKMESEVAWEGKHGAPTQADIDKVNANPTDGMYQMFEDQFGMEALNKAFPMDEEPEPIPLPKPRPKSAPKRK
jgi:hypothetical protein